MHYPPMLSLDASDHLRQLSVTAQVNHERRERARQDAEGRRRFRRARHAERGCEATARPAPAA